MELRFADDSVITIEKEEDLTNALASLNEENDFAVLENGDYFIQAAYNNGTFYIEYRDEKGMHESSDTVIPLNKVQEIFILYWQGNTSWKELLPWEKGENTSASSIHKSKSESPGPSDLKDELFTMAKRSVVNWIKKKIR